MTGIRDRNLKEKVVRQIEYQVKPRHVCRYRDRDEREGGTPDSRAARSDRQQHEHVRITAQRLSRVAQRATCGQQRHPC